MRNNIVITALTCLLLVVNIASFAQKGVVEHYSNKSFDCAIFPDTYPTDFEGKAFIPTHDEVDKACTAIMENLKTISCTSKDNRDEVVKNLAKYKLQIFGFTDKQGSRILYINSFRNDGNKDKELANTWLHDKIEVQNGGVYFWSVEYDLGQDELSSFQESGSQ